MKSIRSLKTRWGPHSGASQTACLDIRFCLTLRRPKFIKYTPDELPDKKTTKHTDKKKKRKGSHLYYYYEIPVDSWLIHGLDQIIMITNLQNISSLDIFVFHTEDEQARGPL